MWYKILLVKLQMSVRGDGDGSFILSFKEYQTIICLMAETW